MARTSIDEMLKQDTIELVEGEYLIATTKSGGYYGIHKGEYAYQVVTGSNGINIAPVVLNEDYTDITVLEDQPIIKETTDGIVYVVPNEKFPYVSEHTVEEETTDKQRKMLLAFINYVQHRFALGVLTWYTDELSYGTTPNVVITGISVDPTSATIAVDGTQQLTASVSPDGSSQDVTYESSDEAIATVDSSGLVTGVAAGTATITVTSEQDSTQSTTAEITVE